MNQWIESIMSEPWKSLGTNSSNQIHESNTSDRRDLTNPGCYQRCVCQAVWSGGARCSHGHLGSHDAQPHLTLRPGNSRDLSIEHPIVGSRGKLWRVVGSGESWEVVGSRGKSWRVVGSRGKSWRVVGSRGESCEVVVSRVKLC